MPMLLAGENLLFILLLLGTVSGVLIGVFLNDKVQQSSESREMRMFIGFPGELFLRMMMLIVLPFITSSVITSLTMIDRKTATKVGKRATVYFLVTSLIATGLSVVLGRVIIKPQTNEIPKSEHTMTKEGSSTTAHALLDMIRNMVPDNIIEASISSTGTKLKERVTDSKFVNISAVDLKSSARNLSSFLKKDVISPWSVSPDSVQVIRDKSVIIEYAGQRKYSSPNILGVLVLSVVIGIVLSGLGDNGKPITDYFSCLFKLVMKLTDIILWFSPIGIGSIIASELVGMEDIKGTVENLGLYISTIVICCLIYGFVILPVIYAILLRSNPFRLLSCVSKALITAFGTSSSTATIPITLTCFEKKKFVDRRLAQFLLPFSTVLNCPGSAIYVAASAVFLCQTFHPNSLNFISSMLICILSPIAVVVAPPIPTSTPVVVWSLVLQSIGIPRVDIGLIVAIDWFIDRFATPINVWSCCVACVIIGHFSRNDLQSSHCVTEASIAVGDHTNAISIDITDEENETAEPTD